MTRPRSQQVNDPSTRYSKYAFRLAPTPGNSSLNIQNDGVNNDYEALLASSATKLDQGVEEDIPAIIDGVGSDPFTGLTPNISAFSITLPGVAGGAAIPILLTPSEFVTLNGGTVATAERVAARVNSILSGLGVTVPVASRNKSGGLHFESANSAGYTTGSSASIILNSITLGVLSSLGITVANSISANGLSKKRGIVTKSRDGLGGYIFPYFENGRRVTQNSKVFKNAGRNSNIQYNVQSTTPNQPIYGRISQTPGTLLTKKFTIGWKTRELVSPEIRSKLGDFTSILNGEGFILYFMDIGWQTGSSVNVVFSASPVTVNDVVTVINNAWHASSHGRVGSVQGTLQGPFIINSGDYIKFSLNGNITITAAFSGSERTASDVVTTINNAINGALQGLQGSASVVDGKVTIDSLIVTGEFSSVEIIEYSKVLRTLGLSVGKYIGTDICFADGAEIIIRPPSRRCVYTLIGASFGILNKLGINGQIPVSPPLPAPPVYSNLLISEIDATYPFDFTSSVSSTTSINPGTSTALFPEYMEAGDIPDNNFSVDNLVNDTTSTDLYPDVWRNGALSSFNSVITDRTGRISKELMPVSIDSISINNLKLSGSGIKLINSYTSGTYDLQSEFRATANNRVIRNYINDSASNAAYEITINAKMTDSLLNYVADDPTKNSSLVRFDRDSLVLYGEFNGNVTMNFAKAGFRRSSVPDNEFEVFTYDGVYNEHFRELRLTDKNVSATEDHYIKLSSSVATEGDDRLRTGEIASSLFGGTKSIIGILNSRPFIVCGDGINSFGDINGTNSFEFAADLIRANSINSAVIYLKRGSYLNTSPVSFADKNITILADPGTTLDVPTTGPGPYFDTISFSSTTGNHELIIEGLKILNGNAGHKSINATDGVGSVVKLNRCYLNNISIRLGLPLNSGQAFLMKDCQIFGGVSGSQEDAVSLYPGITATPATNQVIFENCSITNLYVNTRCLVINGIAGSSKYGPIVFKSCNFYLSSYTVTIDPGTNLPLCAKNTGLVDLEPLNNGRTTAGLVVESLTYENCVVRAINSNSCCALQLPHLPASQIPTDTGNYGIINKLNFSNTNFYLKYSDGEMDGFGKLLVFNPFTTGTGANEVNVNDCTFYMNTSASGGGLTSTAPAWTYWSVNEGIVTEPGYGRRLWNPVTVAGQWGAVTFISRSINVFNTKIIDALRVSSLGDVAFFYGHLNVNGLTVEYNKTVYGSGLDCPFTRIYTSEVRNSGGDKSTVWPGWGLTNSNIKNTASIKNVRLELFNIPNAPPTFGYWVKFPGSALMSFGSNLDIDGFICTGGTYNGWIPSAFGGSGILVGSYGSVNGIDNIKIKNCNLQNLTSGIVYVDNLITGSPRRDIEISNNYLFNINTTSIYMKSYTEVSGVIVKNNISTGNYTIDPSLCPIMAWFPPVNIDNYDSGIQRANLDISDNYVLLNGGITKTLTGIVVGPSVAAGGGMPPFEVQPPLGVVINNTVIFYDEGVWPEIPSYNIGVISIIGADGNTGTWKPFADHSIPMDRVYLNGVETQYETQSVSGQSVLGVPDISLPVASITIFDITEFDKPSGYAALYDSTTGIGYSIFYDKLVMNPAYPVVTTGVISKIGGNIAGYTPVPIDGLKARVIPVRQQRVSFQNGQRMIHNIAYMKNTGTI